MIKVVLFSLILATTVIAKGLPRLKGFGIKTWKEATKKAIKEDKKSFHKILSFPSKNLLKGIEAYTYRRYLIDVFESNPSFFISESNSYFNKNSQCVLSWLLFYKNDPLMNQQRFSKTMKSAKGKENSNFRKLANSFYQIESFIFDSKGCKNNLFKKKKVSKK